MEPNEFRRKIAEILESSTDSLNDDTVFRDCVGWDSLALLSVIAMIDEDYQVIIPQNDFAQMEKIGDILNYIISHKG